VSATSFPDCSPIFVVGSGRSGTTLLQLMLNAHPRIAVAGELGYFDQILQLRRLIPDLSGPEQVDRLFELLPRTGSFKFLSEVEAIFPEAQRKLKADPNPSYEKLYRYILESYAMAHGARRFGEKTPENIRHLDHLISIFPNCRVIHIVRDPRANIASRIKVPIWSNDVATHAIKWKIDILYGQIFLLSNCHAGKTSLEVRYEDLVADPEPCLRKICNFIGEAYDGSMLEYYKSSEHFIKNAPWQEGTYKPVYSSSVQKWRCELTESQIYLIEWITGRQLEHYGYSRSAARFSVRVTSAFQLARELFRWGRYKLQERKARRRGPATIYGANTKLYRMLWRILVMGEGRRSANVTSRARPSASPTGNDATESHRVTERERADGHEQ
jgi:Sulfotransferase family